nr:hypothetical protein Q903MT_gene185 [Picea sitchensis]
MKIPPRKEGMEVNGRGVWEEKLGHAQIYFPPTPVGREDGVSPAPISW